MIIQTPDRKFIPAPDFEIHSCPNCHYFGEKDMFAINRHRGTQWNDWLVTCASCNNDGPSKLTREDAISAWNGLPRSPLSAMEIIEELVSKIIFQNNSEASYRGFQEPIVMEHVMDGINYLIDNGYLEGERRRCAWFANYLREKLEK